MIGDKFNIEEINLIHSCRSRELQSIINELYRYKESSESDMVEIIDRVIYKLSYVTSTQLQEILDYPAENEGI